MYGLDDIFCYHRAAATRSLLRCYLAPRNDDGDLSPHRGWRRILELSRHIVVDPGRKRKFVRLRPGRETSLTQSHEPELICGVTPCNRLVDTSANLFKSSFQLFLALVTLSLIEEFHLSNSSCTTCAQTAQLLDERNVLRNHSLVGRSHAGAGWGKYENDTIDTDCRQKGNMNVRSEFLEHYSSGNFLVRFAALLEQRSASVFPETNSNHTALLLRSYI